MALRARMQVAEALGSDNRWFCSQACGREIDDPDALVTYFVRSGGAEDFDRRFAEAMGHLNRWYCCQFYGYEVHDPEALWKYYMEYRSAGAVRSASCESAGR
jgi:hypothetical protein